MAVSQVPPPPHQQDKFIQESLRFIRARKLIEEGDKVIVAASGGLDSSVLVHVMSRLARLLDIEIEVVHLDHRTRGQASHREGAWVRVLGERLGLVVHSLRLGADGSQLSQAELRLARATTLDALAEERGARLIATAHHADDNAETFLMRAMSGTGTRGLAGIPPSDGRMRVRPLVWATREQLEDYARRHHLGWVEDPSNARGEYLRNRIRLEVMPLLEEIRGGSIRSMGRAAERIEEEESQWDEWIREQFEGPKEILSLGWLEKWPVPLKRRVLRMWVLGLGLEPHPALIEALVKGEEVVHAGGSFLRRSDMLVFNRQEHFAESWGEGLLPLKLGARTGLGPSTAWSFLPGSPVQARTLELNLYLNFRQPQQARAGALSMDWERVPWPLAIRARSKSDLPALDSILDRSGIPRPFWKAWPLIVSEQNPSHVVGILGVEIFEPYRVQDLGRCVCLESFFEDRLGAVSESC